MIISDDLFFKSKRLSYRHLNDSDASDEYVSWFKEKMLDDLFKAQKNLQKKPVYEIIFVVIIQKKTVFFLEFLKDLIILEILNMSQLTLKKK